MSPTIRAARPLIPPLAVDQPGARTQLARKRMALTAAVIAVCLATTSESVAQESARGGAPIYQQRSPDGRIVLTDHPEAGAMTQRSWQFRPDDAETARERRERARLEAISVHRRIQHQIETDLQRDHEFALARLRLASAEANLAAEKAREAANQAVAVFVPSFARRRFPRPPHIPRPLPPRPRLSIPPSVATVGAGVG